MLAIDGKSNSLGKVNEVIELVLHNKSRLNLQEMAISLQPK